MDPKINPKKSIGFWKVSGFSLFFFFCFGGSCLFIPGVPSFRSTFVAKTSHLAVTREISQTRSVGTMAMRPATARGGARNQSPQRDPAPWKNHSGLGMGLEDAF